MKLPEHDRDFRGYAGLSPIRQWPNGSTLAVSVVVNVEEGAELSRGMGDESNEFIYEAVERVEGQRDLCMESHFEYGTRAGWPRLRGVLRQYGVRASMSCNGRAVALSPWLAQEAVADGHEISAHGWRWERHVAMDEAHERKVIADTVDALQAASGTPTVGWHTRSATSVNTRRLLVEHGGFLYDSNAYNDDLPYAVSISGTPHIVLPYSFDTNDMRFNNNGGFVQADDFSTYCIDAFDRLLAESATQPRMLSVGLHLRIIGKAARIGGLEKFLAHASSKTGVWFARRDEIAHAWRAATGLGPWQARR
ncbi:MAG: polysaccharide deacetylase family protein [Telmatospirillum sp.]|nr:polysaccharide deacetylase family protein [Telmatospirillum sp.]